MPLEQRRCAGRAVLKAVVLALATAASVACEDEHDAPPAAGTPVVIGSFRIVGNGMYEAFKRWRTSLNETDRAVLEELIAREDLLVHVFLAVGRLPPDKSRGGASAPASDGFIKQVCDFHPIVGRFEPERNWDVVYDPERSKWFEETHKIPNPPEVVLHHEIFGHLIPALRDPKLIGMAKDKVLNKKLECDALDIENKYRPQVNFPEVPRSLMKCPLTKKHDIAP